MTYMYAYTWYIYTCMCSSTYIWYIHMVYYVLLRVRGKKIEED